MSITLFTGVWKLLEYKYVYSDERIEYPLGLKPIGYIIYTHDQHMSAQLMRDKRRQCFTEDYSNISVDEKIEIANNFLCYMGTYEVIGDHIMHYPKVSSFTNMINVCQKRKYEFTDDFLILSSSWAYAPNQQFSSILTWQKVDS